VLNCYICFNCSFNEIKRRYFSIFKQLMLSTCGLWSVDSGGQCRLQPLCIRILDFENPSIVILGGRCRTERIYEFPFFSFFWAHKEALYFPAEKSNTAPPPYEFPFEVVLWDYFHEKWNTVHSYETKPKEI
jgi:hypothetical protein